MPPPVLLALDTATDQLAVGLLAPGVYRTVNEAGGAAASARLIPLLTGLLEAADLAMPQVQAVAFGQGPGAFTGLRTACAVAQGLAFAHGTPVLPIDSLLIVAEDARAQAAADGAGTDGPWWVAMDARMDEVYAAAYQRGPGGWTVQRGPQLYTLPALAAAWQGDPPARVTGNAATAFADRLPWGTAQRWPHTADRAAALLRLAEAAWVAGATVPADTALPLYLRDKVALTAAERAAGQPARSAPAARPAGPAREGTA
jgi:tRNA threonylcarbamoyladenosine biosynthesis protein TsaB